MFNGSEFMSIEHARFRAFTNDLWIYQHCANCFGLFGNLVIVVTLFSANSMTNSIYNSYRCLHLAELLFNIAYWTEAANNSAFGRMNRNHVYTFSAYENAFVKIVAKFVYSCVTYTCMYMAILAGLDRCFALWFPTKYENIRAKPILVNAIISVSVLIAALVNSWGAFYRWEVTQSTTVHNNQTVQQYWVQAYSRTGFEHDAYEFMNLYNSAIGIVYCLVIILLTTSAVVGYRRLGHLKELVLGDVRFDQPIMVRRGTAVLRREKDDDSIYWLMIVIVALGIGQVLPGELARLMKAYYDGRPEYRFDTCMLANDEQCLRLTLFTIWLAMFSNLLVVLIRNVKFYLYMIWHPQMRNEVNNMLRSCSKKRGTHSDDPVDDTQPYDVSPLSVLGDMQPIEHELPAEHISPTTMRLDGSNRCSIGITEINEVDDGDDDFRTARESILSMSYKYASSVDQTHRNHHRVDEKKLYDSYEAT